MTVSDQDKQRIAKEEETWDAPKLLKLGFIFLGCCLVLIYFMSSV